MLFTRHIIKFIFIMIISFASITNGQNQIIEEDFNISLKTIDKYAIISFELENNAVFYWRNPGELGLPTKFNLAKSTNLKDYKIYWPTPKLVKKEDISSYVYDGNTTFIIELTPKDPNSEINLNTEINFSICQKSCQNIDISLTNTINPTNNSNIPGEVLEILAKMPKENGAEELKITEVYQEKIEDHHWLNIKFTSSSQILEPILYFDLPEYISFDPSKFSVISEENYQIIRLPFSIINTKYNQIEDTIYINLASDSGNIIELSTLPKSNITKDPSFIWIIFCAVLGGLILNVMPCVLPILALKVFQILKLPAENQLFLRKSFIAQSAGIIFSFLMFALATYVLQFLGYKVGLGMHFQQPFYLITMVILLSFIAISLITDLNFNIILPDFIQKFLNKNSTNSRLLSFFTSGVLTTLLAIPCTAPFVTIAVGFALTTDLFNMLIIFLSLGIGMSLPFTIFAIYPSAARFLPKPGNWMNTFKKVIGILIFVTCLWLIYILTTQLGSRAGVILFLLIILIKFIIGENDVLNRMSKSFILMILIGLCYFLPQSIYQDNVIHETSVEQTWQEYSPKDIPSLLDENYIVVVDVSASWCATCSINKFTTLNNSSVLSTMKKFKLIAMRADISKHTSNEVINLMKLKNHRGIPFTLIYSKHNPEGIVLPTILTPHTLISAIKNELD